MESREKLSLYDKLTIAFCSLFAEIIRKSFTSIIPFICFEVYEIFQNIVFISWICSEGREDNINFFFSLFLFVGKIYMKNIIAAISIVAIIISCIYILYLCYIFIIILRNIKEKFKLSRYNIIICQLAFFVYEKILLIPIIYGIMIIDNAFGISSTDAIGLIILKLLLLLIFSAISIIVSVFYNNDIPNSNIKWSCISKSYRFLDILNRILIPIFYSLYPASITSLAFAFLVFNIMCLIILLKSNIPQSLIIYFVLLFQSYSSILFSIILIIDPKTYFYNYLFLSIPSLLLAKISITLKLNSFEKLLNYMIPNIRTNRNNDISINFWAIRYLLAKIKNLENCNANELNEIYSFLSNHNAYCTNNSCSCIELSKILFGNEINNISSNENRPLISLMKRSKLNNHLSGNRSAYNWEPERNKRNENIPIIKVYFAKLALDLISSQLKCKEKNKAELYLEKSYIFYIFFDNPYLAMYYIVKGRMLARSFVTSFNFFVLFYFIQNDIEKENQIEEAKNQRNSLKLTEFNIFFHSFVNGLRNGSKISLKLLDEIMKKNQDIILILKLATKFHKKITALRMEYEEITKIFGSSMKISLYYSVFLLELMGNSNDNELIINDAKGLFTQINKDFVLNSIEQRFGQYSPTYCMLISLNPNSIGKIIECSSDAAYIFGFKVEEIINNNFHNLIPEILSKNQRKSNDSDDMINFDINFEAPQLMVTLKKNKSIFFIYYYKKNVLRYDVNLNYYLVFTPCTNLNTYFNTSINILLNDSIILLLNHKMQIINFSEKVFELFGLKNQLNFVEIQKFKMKIDLVQLLPELKDDTNLSLAYKESGCKININLYLLLSQIAKCIEDQITVEIAKLNDINFMCETRIFMKNEKIENSIKSYTIMAINLNTDSSQILTSNEDNRKEDDEINLNEQKMEHVEVEDLMSSSVSSLNSMSNFSQSIKVKNELLMKIQGKTVFFDSVKKYCYLLFIIYIIQIVAVVVSQVLEKSSNEEMSNSLLAISEVTDLLYYTFLSVSYYRILMNIMIGEEPNSSELVPNRFDFYLTEAALSTNEIEISRDILNNLYFVNPSFNSMMSNFSNVLVYEIGKNDNETNPREILTKMISLKNLCDNLVDKVNNLLTLFTIYNKTNPIPLNESLRSDLHKNMFYVNKNSIESFLRSYSQILDSVIEASGEKIYSNFIYIIILLICIFSSIMISTIILVPFILLKLKLCSRIISVIVKSKFYSFHPVYDKVLHIIELLNDSYDKVKLFFSQILSRIPGDNQESLSKNIEDKIMLKTIKEKELKYSMKIKNRLYYRYKFNLIIRAIIPVFIFVILVGTFINLSYTNREKTKISLKIIEYSNKIQPYLEVLIVILKNNIAYSKIQINKETGKDELDERIYNANENFDFLTDVILANKQYFPLSRESLIALETSNLCYKIKEITNKEACLNIFQGIMENGLSFCLNLIFYNIKRNHFLIVNNLPKSSIEKSLYNSDDNILLPIDIVNYFFHKILDQLEKYLDEDSDIFFNYQRNLINIKLIVFVIISTFSCLYWVFLLIAYVDFQIGYTYSLLISLPNDTFAEFYILFNKEINNLL